MVGLGPKTILKAVVVMCAAVFSFGLIVASRLESTAAASGGLGDRVVGASHAPASDPSSTSRAAEPPALRLVIHVGPVKTATTSIQCNLAALEKLGVLSGLLRAKVAEIESCRPSAEEANSRLEKYQQEFPSELIDDEFASPSSSKLNTYKKVVEGGSFFPHCIAKWIDHHNATESYPDCWGNSYTKFIRNHHARGHNLFIISNELLSAAFGEIKDPKQCNSIFNFMLDSLGGGSEIEIVHTQRYWSDWAVSLHGQEYDGEKEMAGKPRMKRWPGEGEGQGGKHIPTLCDYITRLGSKMESLMRSIQCFRTASDSSERIHLRIIDFTNDASSSFFNILTRDESLTPKLTNTNTGSQKAVNSASSRRTTVPYDRIAIAAQRQGYFSVTTPREKARLHIKGLVKGLEMVYTCPSEEFYKELLRKSIMLQKTVFYQKSNTEEEVSRAFWDAVERRHFCDVDGDAMIERIKEKNKLLGLMKQWL